MLRLQLEPVAFLDRQLETLSDAMGARLAHEEDAITHLEPIPGVGRRIAETIGAEVGTAMQRFPSAGHLVSWAGFSPGQNESGGKAKPAPAPILAPSIIGSPDRRGANCAATAVGRHILIAAYHILTNPETVYQDLGAHDFDERDRAAVIRRATQRLEALGVRVTVELSEPVTS